MHNSIFSTLFYSLSESLQLFASTKPLVFFNILSNLQRSLCLQGSLICSDLPLSDKAMAPTAPSFNCIISPFNKHWDLSLKADQECWLVASKAASDHVRFDIFVATAEQFLELLKDKSEYYRWDLLMSVQTKGDGSFDQNKDRLANGDETMKVTITRRVNLLNLWLTLKSMNRLIPNYGTVYLSNG